MIDVTEDELIEYLQHLARAKRSPVRSRQIDAALDGLIALGWGEVSDA